MSDYLVKEIGANERIRVLLNSQIEEALGEHNLESITILDTSSGDREEVPSQALFVMIGAQPIPNGWSQAEPETSEASS